jgi:hypothetical protein
MTECPIDFKQSNNDHCVYVKDKPLCLPTLWVVS